MTIIKFFYCVKNNEITCNWHKLFKKTDSFDKCLRPTAIRELPLLPVLAWIPPQSIHSHAKSVNR